MLVSGGAGTAGTVDLGGFDNTTNFLETGGLGTAALTNTIGTATLTILGNQSRTFNGSLQGNLGIVKQGSSIQSFLNTNPASPPSTMTGPITLQQGALAVGSNDVFGTSVITVTGASALRALAGFGVVSLGNNIALDAQLSLAPASNTALTLAGNISGANGIVLLGTGTLSLTGNNSFNGASLGSARVQVGSNTALGIGTVTGGTGILALSNPAVGVNLGNNFASSGTALNLQAGNTGSIFQLSGVIAGSRSVLLAAGSGGGTVLLSGANTYTGDTRVASGVLGIGSATAISNSSSIRLEANGTGIAMHTAGQTVNRQITSLADAGTVSATINTRGFDTVFSGRLNDAATGVDNLALTKTGGGILTVSNAASAPGSRSIVTGGFNVNDGTLNLTGALHNDVTVNAGGRLSGTGTVSLGTTTIGAGADLSPGDRTLGFDATGRLTFTNLTLNGGSTLNFDLGAPSIDPLTTPNDIVVVNGDLDLGGVLNVNDLAGFGNGTFRVNGGVKSGHCGGVKVGQCS